MREVYISMMVIGIIIIISSFIVGFFFRKKYLERNKEKSNQLGKNKMVDMTYNEMKEMSMLQFKGAMAFYIPMVIGVLLGFGIAMFGLIKYMIEINPYL